MIVHVLRNYRHTQTHQYLFIFKVLLIRPYKFSILNFQFKLLIVNY